MRIVRLDGTIIEGTPQELASFEVQLTFSASTNKRMTTPGESTSFEDGDRDKEPDFRFVQPDVALRALTRIKLSEKQILILKKLYEAGINWVLASALQQVSGYEPSQFAGLMGAFGRRVSHTPGYVAYSAFFDQEWNANSACYQYRLPETVREALRLAKLV
jgi:hypothetical protein